MEYSRLTDIIIQNFKSIEKAHIKAGGITVFKGGNGTGKTTILEALQVALTDYKPTRQNTLIKHKKDFFRIHLKFDDGVEIIKDKYAKGGTLYEMYKDGKCLYTNRSGKKITAIKGVPDIIADYIGIPVFEKRVINFQDSEQDLLLVQTRPGENYKMLGKASDDGSLPKTLEMLTLKKKDVNGKLMKTEEDIRYYEKLQREIPDVPQGMLDRLEELDKNFEKLSGECTEIASIVNLIEDVQSNKEVLGKPIEKISHIDEIEAISEIINLCEEINKPVGVPIAKAEGYDEIASIVNILDLIHTLKETQPFNAFSKIETAEIEAIENILHLLKEAKEIKDRCLTLEAEKKKALKELHEVEMKLRNEGYLVSTCPHCGKDHIVDLMESK